MSRSYGHFKVKSKLKLSELELGSVIPEADFSTLTPDGTFVQLEYISEEEFGVRPPYDVHPGTYSIMKTSSGFVLEKTAFLKDSILDSFNESNEVEEKIDCFFSRLDVYYKLGFEVPKRSILVWGPAGTGKTTRIIKTSQKYVADGKTVTVIWPTDKFEAFEVKDFIKTFRYNGIEKMIFILEDLGGVEMEEARMRSDPSLLSLLDNQEKTFMLPVMIIATTNHPEMFLANLTNRPNRIDDKIKVGYPKAASRLALLEFFAKEITLSDDAKTIIQSKECEKFTPAHIRDVVIRSMIYDKTPEAVMSAMTKEIKEFEKQFAENNGGMGFR